jgi:hypothetical protein
VKRRERVLELVRKRNLESLGEMSAGLSRLRLRASASRSSEISVMSVSMQSAPRAPPAVAGSIGAIVTPSLRARPSRATAETSSRL